MSDPLEPTSATTILIVDDTPDNLRLLTKILESRDYIVRKSLSGRMAIQSATAEPPDLILLDINMPDMNGYEVCQRLKESAPTSEIPIIFISALDRGDDKIQAFNRGGQDYITKPFQELEILVRVKNQLLIRKQQKLLLEIERRLEREIQARLQAEAEIRRLSGADDLTR